MVSTEFVVVDAHIIVHTIVHEMMMMLSSSRPQWTGHSQWRIPHSVTTHRLQMIIHVTVRIWIKLLLQCKCTRTIEAIVTVKASS